jgi:hypothetical protein
MVSVEVTISLGGGVGVGTVKDRVIPLGFPDDESETGLLKPLID